MASFIPPSIWGDMLEQGNIDISNRKSVPNPFTGGFSTVFSQGVSGPDGIEVVHPRVIGDRVVSPDDAWKHYQDTGENLGKFKSVEAANLYGNLLHQDQENHQFGSKKVTPAWQTLADLFQAYKDKQDAKDKMVGIGFGEWLK
jgi:hypothetical protein